MNWSDFKIREFNLESLKKRDYNHCSPLAHMSYVSKDQILYLKPIIVLTIFVGKFCL
jgi:hypothetical protein